MYPLTSCGLAGVGVGTVFFVGIADGEADSLAETEIAKTALGMDVGVASGVGAISTTGEIRGSELFLRTITAEIDIKMTMTAPRLAFQIIHLILPPADDYNQNVASKTDSNTTVSLRIKLAEQPISLPSNPFLDVLRTFGRDELISLVINIVATGIISRFAVSKFVLSISGPIIEKVGFFMAYFQEAWNIYQTTKKEQRESLRKYVFKAIKKGLNSLTKDIVFHDPTYTILMYSGLQSYPQTPAWMLSALAFLIAVTGVALGEVTVNEILYRIHALRLMKFGFRMESYYEARFIVDKKYSKKILTDLSTAFSLKKKGYAQYQDRYYESNLTGYNSRTPKFRLRKRTGENGGWMQTVQIVYTRASEMAMRKPTQFNFYPTRKDKLWFSLNQKMPWVTSDIKDASVRSLCNRVTNSHYFHDVYFNRTIYRNPDNILVSIDQVKSDDKHSFTVVEIKSHTDKISKTLLIEAMRYLMLNYPVIQTTHTKSFLTSINS